MEENTTKAPGSWTEIEQLMADYGITDEILDSLEKESEEQHKQLLEKWDNLVKKVIAGEPISDDDLPVVKPLSFPLPGQGQI